MKCWLRHCLTDLARQLVQRAATINEYAGTSELPYGGPLMLWWPTGLGEGTGGTLCHSYTCSDTHQDVCSTWRKNLFEEDGCKGGIITKGKHFTKFNSLGSYFYMCTKHSAQVLKNLMIFRGTDLHLIKYLTRFQFLPPLNKLFSGCNM